MTRIGFAGRIAEAFLASKLTPLLIAASLALGALALVATPREEEPQIRVPMVDVVVAWPGAEPGEAEKAKYWDADDPTTLDILKRDREIREIVEAPKPDKAAAAR